MLIPCTFGNADGDSTVVDRYLSNARLSGDEIQTCREYRLSKTALRVKSKHAAI